MDKRKEKAVIGMLEAIKLKSELNNKVRELESLITLDMFGDYNINCDVPTLELLGAVIEKSKNLDTTIRIENGEPVGLFGEPEKKAVTQVAQEYQEQILSKVKR